VSVPRLLPTLFPTLFLPTLLLVALATGAADARDRKSIVVRMPRIALPASSNSEVCYFARIPTTEAFTFGSWTITHAGVKNGTLPQHGLAYVYTGDDLGAFPAAQVVQSRGCLDVGPGDRDRRVLIASGTSKKTARALPLGVGVELTPVPDAPGGAPAGIGILLDVNWINGDTRTKKVSTKLVLRRVAKGRAKRTAHLMSDHGADAGILVPPFTRHSTAELVDARWTPPGDVCLLGLSSQMHRRGRCADVDLLDGTGQVKPPMGGIPNPCEDLRLQLFVGADFTDPGSLAFTSPLAVRAGESLRYACTIDNGASAGASVRLGCETSPGVTPGTVGTPAALCSVAVPASPECPGNAGCVFANAVAGSDVEDEVCGITAMVYEAAPGGSCDVSSLP
jgi:hypothetical protein